MASDECGLSPQEIYYRRMEHGLLIESNCVWSAIEEFIEDSSRFRFHIKRNRSGRWHCFWSRGDQYYEFYAPDRAGRTYCQNLHYLGYIRRIK